MAFFCPIHLLEVLWGALQLHYSSMHVHCLSLTWLQTPHIRTLLLDSLCSHTHAYTHKHTMQHILQRLIASCRSLLLNIWQPLKASISQTLITEGSSCEWSFWASNMLVRCSNRNPKFFSDYFPQKICTIRNNFPPPNPTACHWHCTTWSEDSHRQTSVEKAITWQKPFEKLPSHF